MVDCAPLLVAQEEGFFRQQGLEVRLSSEVGWAAIREKLAGGELEAAQAVCGLSLTLPLGLQAPPCEVGAVMVFNLHGSAITLSQDLWRRGVRGAEDLGKLVRSTRQRLLTLATVSRVSASFFMLSRWLQEAGLDPQREVRLLVLPLSQMVPSLQDGLIDGFCAGEPWNSMAVAEGVGWVAATSAEMMPNHPEKVLLAGAVLLRERADERAALIRALAQACAFCEDPARRSGVAELLASSGHFRASRQLLEKSLVGPFDSGVGPPRTRGRFHLFHGGEVNRPTLEKARWVVRGLTAHGVVPAAQAAALRRLASAVWRDDLYTEALAGSIGAGPGLEPVLQGGDAGDDVPTLAAGGDAVGF